MVGFDVGVGDNWGLSSVRLPRSHIGNCLDRLTGRWSSGSLLVFFLWWRLGIGMVIPAVFHSRMRRVMRHWGPPSGIVLIMTPSIALVPR